MCRKRGNPEENSSRESGGVLGFVAFLVTIFAAVLYLVALILQFIHVTVPVIDTMRSVASMLTICIVALLGWKFVKRRATWCKVLYVLLVLAVVVCVVLPIVLHYIPQ